MKTTMAGQKIPMASKVRSAASIYRAHRDRVFGNATGTLEYHDELRGYFDRFVGKPIAGARVLDLGCGQTATQTALFHADGARVTGIDIEVPTYRMSPLTFMRVWRRNGTERAFKSLARHVLFDRRFFAELSKEYGRAVRFNGLDTRIMDATSMAFEDATFDFIYSMAVFEHISDIRPAVAELNRVLAPGGIAVITPHLFPSLSGGHCLDWIWPDEKASDGVPPWDHLRENRYPPAAYMNKLKIDDYRDVFQAEMDVVDEQVVVEGERLLTPELQDELGRKGYSREDLLTRTITFYARKKREAASDAAMIAGEVAAR